MKPGVCLTNCLDPNIPTRYPSHTGRPWREVERSLRNASVFMIQTHSKRSDWWWLNQPLGEKIAQVKLDHFRFPQVWVKINKYLKPPPRKHSKTPYPNQYKGMAAADAGLHVRQPEIHRRHRLENIPQVTRSAQGPPPRKRQDPS